MCWIATRSEIFRMMSKIMWLNQIIYPVETIFSSLPCLSFTCPSKVTLHPSQLPWWGDGQCRSLGLLDNDFFFPFLVSYSFSSINPCFLLLPCSDIAPLGDAVSQQSAFFFPLLLCHLFPHNIPFHVPFVPPHVSLLPYLKTVWAEASCASPANGSFGTQWITPCQSWLIVTQRRKQPPPTQGTWQLTAGQTLLVMSNKFHILLLQNILWMFVHYKACFEHHRSFSMWTLKTLPFHLENRTDIVGPRAYIYEYFIPSPGKGILLQTSPLATVSHNRENVTTLNICTLKSPLLGVSFNYFL